MTAEKFVFFLDIDGTLLWSGGVNDADREAIARAHAAGHRFLINTARSKKGIPSEVLPLSPDGCVSGIGTCVTVNGKKIVSESLPTEEVAQLFDEFIAEGQPVLFEGENVLVCSPDSEFSAQEKTAENGRDLLERFGTETFSKSFLRGVLSEADQRRFSERYSFIQHADYAEFCVKGFSKATGMRAVLEELGIDRAHSVAIGDSLNDLDMLRCAGISVAMGNAVDEVKRECDFVTRPVWESGVAYAIEQILAGNVISKKK